MSYCRWSDNFGECDVYVYANVYGGRTVHVAGSRLKHKLPENIKRKFPTNYSDGDAWYMIIMNFVI